MTVLHPIANLAVRSQRLIFSLPKRYKLSTLRKAYKKRGYKFLMGHKFILNLEDQVHSTTLLLNNIWESAETWVLMAMLEPGEVFLDIGANIGYYTLLAASRVGKNGVIFAYEPEPLAHAILLENIRNNGYESTVKAFQTAVGSEDGFTDLYLGGRNAGDHRTWKAEGENRKTIQVPLGKIDSQTLIDLKVNALKMDTQGSEMEILSTMLDFLESDRRFKMLIEFWPYGLKGAGAKPIELLELLRRNSFSIYVIENGFQQLSDDEILNTCGYRGFVTLYVERQ